MKIDIFVDDDSNADNIKEDIKVENRKNLD